MESINVSDKYTDKRLIWLLKNNGNSLFSEESHDREVYLVALLGYIVRERLKYTSTINIAYGIKTAIDEWGMSDRENKSEDFYQVRDVIFELCDVLAELGDLCK